MDELLEHVDKDHGHFLNLHLAVLLFGGKVLGEARKGDRNNGFRKLLKLLQPGRTNEVREDLERGELVLYTRAS